MNVPIATITCPGCQATLQLPLDDGRANGACGWQEGRA